MSGIKWCLWWIEKFMDEHLSGIPANQSVEEEFEFFWEKEKRLAIEKLAAEENLNKDKLASLVTRYEMSEELPLRDDFADTLESKPTILQRKKIVSRLTEKFKGFVDTFAGGF